MSASEIYSQIKLPDCEYLICRALIYMRGKAYCHKAVSKGNMIYEPAKFLLTGQSHSDGLNIFFILRFHTSNAIAGKCASARNIDL